MRNSIKRAASLVAALILATCVSGHDGHNSFVRTHHCGAHDLTSEQLQQDAARMNQRRYRRRRTEKCVQCIKIDTYFHIISGSNGVGNVTNRAIQKQIDVLNTAFGRTAFYFELDSITRTANDQWFSLSDPREETSAAFEREMKDSLRQGGATALNIYSVDMKYLGFASSPIEYSVSDSKNDGVVVLHSTLPGGVAHPFNFGFTLVHEVGHWLGLLHVFAPDCDGPGDMVHDTAPQRSPTYGCSERKDSCHEHPGKDNVKNFMDYSDDACMSEFTSGQAERMLDQWYIYRQKDEECGPGEVIIEVDVNLDEKPEEISWSLVNEGGSLMAARSYDANRDSNDRLVSDFCIPVGVYVFTILDQGGDGICCDKGEGRYKISVDGEPIKKGGNFGHQESTEIMVQHANQKDQLSNETDAIANAPDPSPDITSELSSSIATHEGVGLTSMVEETENASSLPAWLTWLCVILMTFAAGCLVYLSVPLLISCSSPVEIETEEIDKEIP